MQARSIASPNHIRNASRSAEESNPMPGGDDGRRLDFTHSRQRYWAGGSAKLIACRVVITDSPASVDELCSRSVWHRPN